MFNVIRPATCYRWPAITIATLSFGSSRSTSSSPMPMAQSRRRLSSTRSCRRSPMPIRRTRRQLPSFLRSHPLQRRNEPVGHVARHRSVNAAAMNDQPVLTGDLAGIVAAGRHARADDGRTCFSPMWTTRHSTSRSRSIPRTNGGEIRVNGVAASELHGERYRRRVVAFVHDGTATPTAEFAFCVDDFDQDGSAPSGSIFVLTVDPVMTCRHSPPAAARPPGTRRPTRTARCARRISTSRPSITSASSRSISALPPRRSPPSPRPTPRKARSPIRSSAAPTWASSRSMPARW